MVNVAKRSNRRALNLEEIARAAELNYLMVAFGLDAADVSVLIGRSKHTVRSYRNKRRAIPDGVLADIKAAMRKKEQTCD